MKLHTLFCCAVSLLLMLGCSSIVEKAAQDASPAAVESGLSAIDEPENKEKVHNIVSEAVGGGKDSVVDTILVRLADPSNEKRLRKITQVISSQILADLGQPASPSAQRSREALINDSVHMALRAAMTELNSTLPELIAAVVTNPKVKDAIAPVSRTAAQGAAKGVGDTITGQAPQP
jgi:hypothetical protein